MIYIELCISLCIALYEKFNYIGKMSTSGFNTLWYDGNVEVISVLINHQAALSIENILFVKYFLIEMGGMLH